MGGVARLVAKHQSSRIRRSKIVGKVRGLLLDSYSHFALKRMLKALPEWTETMRPLS